MARMIGQFVIGENASGYDIGAHDGTPSVVASWFDKAWDAR